MGGIKWRIHKLKQQIWFWIIAYTLLGAVTALAAVFANIFVPPDAIPNSFGSEAVSTLLTILASSLLAVTTFSLSIMVSAFGSAATGATPRATALLMKDPTTQNVLATFIGGFVFSMVGLIGLQSQIYGKPGRFVLFWVTLVVLVAILWQLVRWIGHLAHYGRLGDTINRVEAAAQEALSVRLDNPYLGGMPASPQMLEQSGIEVYPTSIGYIEHVDLPMLNNLAQSHDCRVLICDLPGSFVHYDTVVLKVFGITKLPDDIRVKMAAAFSVTTARSFEQDPRFGIITLAEIGSRALSSAINDPGTAIDIIGRFVRVFASWREKADPQCLYPNVHVLPLRVDDLLEDAFLAMTRDAAGLIEIQLRIQKALLSLTRLAPEIFGQGASYYSSRSLVVSLQNMTLPEDLDRVRNTHDQIKEIVENTKADKAAKRA